jgi:hypothetical protein
MAVLPSIFCLYESEKGVKFIKREGVCIIEVEKKVCEKVAG